MLAHSHSYWSIQACRKTDTHTQPTTVIHLKTFMYSRANTLIPLWGGIHNISVCFICTYWHLCYAADYNIKIQFIKLFCTLCHHNPEIDLTQSLSSWLWLSFWSLLLKWQWCSFWTQRYDLHFIHCIIIKGVKLHNSAHLFRCVIECIIIIFCSVLFFMWTYSMSRRLTSSACKILHISCTRCGLDDLLWE